MLRISRPTILLLLTCLITTVLLAGCARKPLIPLCVDAAPGFFDDLDIASLQKAVQHNLEYLHQQPQEKIVHISDKPIPLKRITDSLEYFLTILVKNPAPEELDRIVREHFDIYQASGTRGFNPWRKMLVTGYFQPVFEGSMAKKPPFLYPLYSIPNDLIRDKTKKNFYRLENGNKVPYWTRKEIEKNNRAAGHEMVWLKDPFDAFILHVQGSGLIRLQDGNLKGIHYAAKNGQPYRSIGKYMVKTKRITLEEASLETIRAYITNNPEEREEILLHNPSFIFFEWTKTHGAIGNLGKELVPGRSIAVDQSCFPAGALAFLISQKPTKTNDRQIRWSPFKRFVLVQDTGSAIRGPGRVDLFWGTGAKAGFEAGHMKEKGALYFLILKDEGRIKMAQQ